MEETGRVAPDGSARRVRVPWFPVYGELRTLQMDPTAFEHLVARVLEAMDYEKVKVTRQSGDGESLPRVRTVRERPPTSHGIPCMSCAAEASANRFSAPWIARCR